VLAAVAMISSSGRRVCSVLGVAVMISSSGRQQQHHHHGPSTGVEGQTEGG